MGTLPGRKKISNPRSGVMHVVKAGEGVPEYSYFITWEDIVIAMKEDHPVIVPIVANVASLPATAKVGKPYFVRDVGAIYVFDIDGQWKGSQILDVEEDGIAYVRKDKTWVPATDVEHNTDKIIPIDSIAESVSEIATNQQGINIENKTAIFTIRDAIRRLAGAAVTINIGATPQTIGVAETDFDFVTSFPSTNEDVITTDDVVNEITLKLDGRYQFGTYAVFTNASTNTNAIITVRTRFTDNNGINTERNITVPKNSTYIAPITNVPFDLTGAPRTIKITFQSNIANVNITQLETTLTTSAGTVASGGGAGLPDTWYTDNAAVRAITGYADGYDVGVYATGAIYEFSAVLTNADDDDTYIKPDDIGVGDPGRWVKRKTFVVESEIKSIEKNPFTETIEIGNLLQHSPLYTQTGPMNLVKGLGSFIGGRYQVPVNTNGDEINTTTDIRIVKNDYSSLISGEYDFIFEMRSDQTIRLEILNASGVVDNKPIATSILIGGLQIVDSQLQASYIYYDADDDPESGSIYQWYRADNAFGANEVQIGGATLLPYTLTSSDLNKYLRIGITVANAKGAGNEVFSAYTGQINDISAEAQAFIQAAGITDSIEKQTVVYLTESLKNAGLADFTTPSNSKIRGFYPFLGGTGASHKWNLIDPQDTDAAYRLEFVNDDAAQHTTDGWTPNSASSRYCLTKMIPANDLTNTVVLGVYSTTQTASIGVDVGLRDDTTLKSCFLNYRNNTTFGFRNNNVSIFRSAPESSTGLLLGNRITSTLQEIMLDGAVIIRNTADDSANTLSAFEVTLGAFNKSGVISNYTDRTYSCYMWGENMNNAEAETLSDIVEKAMNMLGKSNLSYLEGTQNTMPFYISAGQSNVGRAQVSTLTQNQYKGLIPKSFIYAPYASRKWKQINTGFNTPLINPNQVDEFGAEASLMYNLESYTSSESCLFKYGRGGASLGPTGTDYDWLPSLGELYDDFITELDYAIGQAISKGIRPELKAFDWMQGESDAENFTNSQNYLTNLTSFFDQFAIDWEVIRAKYNLPVTDYKKLIGRINYPNANPTYRANVRQAQADYCAIPANNAILIDTDSYTLQPDNLHYDADGQVDRGIDIFNLVKDL